MPLSQIRRLRLRPSGQSNGYVARWGRPLWVPAGWSLWNLRTPEVLPWGTGRGTLVFSLQRSALCCAVSELCHKVSRCACWLFLRIWLRTQYSRRALRAQDRFQGLRVQRPTTSSSRASLLLFCFLKMCLFERKVQGKGGQGQRRERIPSRFQAKQGAGHRARSHHSEIFT